MTTAEQLRDEGMAAATNAADPRIVLTIDRVILDAIASGEKFSADTIRDRLPTTTSAGIVGARVRSFAGRTPRMMYAVGMVRSTHPATRRAWIRQWVGSVHGQRVGS